MASVSYQKIVKNFGDVRVIKGLDLFVGEGELVVFVGPSGCGKTTLLRLIAGLEEVTSGTLCIGDRMVNDVPPKHRNVSMVFQNYALFPHMTVVENIGFGLKVRGTSKAEREAAVQRVADMLGLSELRLIAGLEEVTSGTLCIGDRMVNDVPPKHRTSRWCSRTTRCFRT